MNTTHVTPELDRRFRAAAAASGPLDVAFDLVETPVGELLVAVTDRGLCRVSFDPDAEAEVETLARGHGLRVLRAPARLDEPKRQLAEYFEGDRREFDLRADLTGVAPFQADVLRGLARVPFGEVTTYGALARSIGRPRGARAVGGALNRNPIPIVLPCHRVVGAAGDLVGYGGGLDRKRALLRLEGLTAA
jgi:methylated-DNA-[protein]-cysteine S-methyltransferase